MNRSGIDSRRLGARQNRGRITRRAGSSVADTEALIFGAMELFVRADLGSVSGAAWPDQSGNARDFSQPTGASQPVYTASDPTLNGLPSLAGDGTKFMTATLDRPAPGLGTETSVISVVKQTGWVGAAHLYGAGNQTMAAVQGGASPGIVMRNPTSVLGSSGATINSWVVIAQVFSGSVDDMNWTGSAVVVTGASAGTTDPGATWTIMGRTAGSSLCQVSYFSHIVVAGRITQSQVNRYKNMMAALTGGAVAP